MQFLRHSIPSPRLNVGWSAVLVMFAVCATSHQASAQVLGGVDLGGLTNYVMFFADGNDDANWQGATKGFVGDVAVNGVIANERTSGNVPFAGTIFTNDSTLSAWQAIVTDNGGQASASTNNVALIQNLQNALNAAFLQINALAATSSTSNPQSSVSNGGLNGLNTQNGVGNTYVINVTGGFQVSSQIAITGDANDFFILRWDTDLSAPGYQGQVKFQSGGAIVPLGGLTPTNFVHVAGDINSSGGGGTPPAPYPQGPRSNNGQGALINGASSFSGGGFFTGYWLTTGAPTNAPDATHSVRYGDSSSMSNGIFVGGWYTICTKFSLTSGTSAVYVSPPPLHAKIGNRVFIDTNCDGIQSGNDGGLPGVTVNLFDCNSHAPNEPILTTTTNNNGAYEFCVEAGTYKVGFVTPNGFVITSPNQGNNPALDSDAQLGSLKTAPVTVVGGQIRNDLDAGFCVCAGVPAVTTNLGGSCNLALDPTITANRAVLGTQFNLQLQSPFPNTQIFPYVSAGPVTPFVVSNVGCTIYVDLLNPVNFVLLGEFQTDANGAWAFTLPVPNNALLAGVEIIFQVRLCAPGGPVGPLAPDWLSNGLSVRLGCP